MSKEWIYNLYPEQPTWSSDTYETREAVIEAARNVAYLMNLNHPNKIKIAEIGTKSYISIPGVDVDEILENIDENYHSELSGDWDGGEYIFEDITIEQQSELEESLNEVLYAWLEKYKIEPGYFQVDDIEEIPV